jgi:4-hydroxy-tetrahydrodipicolinate synthase
MSRTVELQGIIPVVPTCFDEDGELDLDSQANLVRYYIRCGVQGLQLFGNASEYYALSDTEQSAILDLVCREVGGALPVVVAVGGGGLEDAVTQVRSMANSGASAVLLRSPVGARKDDPRAVLPYYLQILLGAEIEVILQDSAFAGERLLPISILHEVERMVGRLRYIKVEAPWTVERIRQLNSATGERTRFLAGQNGMFLIQEKQAGAVGSMVGSDLTPHYLKIWQCCERQQWTQAWAHFMHLLPLICFEMQVGMGVSAIKNNLAFDGVIRTARVRPPTPTLGGYALEQLAFLRDLVIAGSAEAGTS